MRSHHGYGFTVLELLVTVCIVTLLIAILIPTVSAVRRRSKVTLCASNLRQIGQAIQTYRSELKRWPDACPIPSPFNPPGEALGRSLAEVLSPYLPARSAVYRCPGDDEVFDKIAAQPNGFGTSFIYWTPFVPKSITMMLTDFQGYSGPARTVTVGQFHPPQRGMNELRTDGSVEFGLANPTGR